MNSNRRIKNLGKNSWDIIRKIVWIVIISWIIFWGLAIILGLIWGRTDPINSQVVKDAKIYRVYTVPDKNYLVYQVVKILEGEGLTQDEIQRAIQICWNESGFENIRGKIDPEDYGIWQISMRYWEDEISREDAMDIEKSTKWAAKYLKESPEMWKGFRISIE